MAYSISQEDLQNLGRYYQSGGNSLRWPYPFILPGWLGAWWGIFGGDFEPLVLVVGDGTDVAGIAPLKLKDGTASFIGDNSVCDYLDFIVAPGKEDAFSSELLDSLFKRGVKSLVMETLRPDSSARRVAAAAQERGWRIECSKIDVSYEMDLPGTWEGYLASLDSRQRRDVERKMRQLNDMADVRFTVLRDKKIGKPDLESFFIMMTDSRRDKAQFLTPEMRSFFESEVSAVSSYGALRLGFLDVGVARVAAILYFEYNDRIYLYNSGYAPQYAEMNVGLVSKLYCIKRSIEERKKVFDFLKGSEVYKSRLGGREIALSRCTVNFG